MLAGGLLLVVGVLAALAAVQLLGAAAGLSVSAWSRLPLPATAGGWATLLTPVAGALLAIVLVELPRREHILTVSVNESGAVLLPAAALERLVEGTALSHHEVLRAEAGVRSHAGRIAPRLRVALRPLADAEKVSAELADVVAAALASRTGLPLERPVVRVRSVSVRRLGRYLP
ncbi:MAG TPA: hypothetical protein VJ787_00660 [Thermoleophilia bacterium]|nr:hypothetical protein [Thermoleophilia bacterium]